MAKKIKSVKIRVISVICVLFSHPSPFFPFLPLLPPILFSFLPPFTKHSFHTKHLFQKHYLTAKQPFPFLTLLARYLNFHLFHPLPVFVRQNHFRGENGRNHAHLRGYVRFGENTFVTDFGTFVKML